MSFSGNFLPRYIVFLTATLWSAATFGTNIMYSQLIVLDLGTECSLDLARQLRQFNIGDLAASVAEQMIVRFGDLIKAIGNTVNM